MTQHKKTHHIKWHDHDITSHHMTWHVATNHINTPHVTSQATTLLHLSPQPTSWHQNESHHHHGTSPPWNGWTLVRTKNSVWVSHWFVSLRTFYRQILSLVDSFFPFWNFRPWLARELLVAIKAIAFNCVLVKSMGVSFQNPDFLSLSQVAVLFFQATARNWDSRRPHWWIWPSMAKTYFASPDRSLRWPLPPQKNGSGTKIHLANPTWENS